MRRVSSSSCASRPEVPMDRTAMEMTTAMMNTTTRISIRVKPVSAGRLMRM